MSKLNLFVTGNTLQARVEAHVSKVYLKDAYTIKLRQKEEELTKKVAGLAKNAGTVGFDEEELRTVAETLRSTQEKLAKVGKMEEFKLSLSDDDKLLKKEYNKATTDAGRAEALAVWFSAHGFSISAGRGELMYILARIGGASNNSRKLRVENFTLTKEVRNFPMSLFWNVLGDLYIQSGIIKRDVIPTELVEYYDTLRAEAKKRNEEKRNAKKNNK